MALSGMSSRSESRPFSIANLPSASGPEIAYVMSDWNGVQAVSAVDEVFYTDESIVVRSSENLIGYGVKYGQLLIGKGYKSFGKEVQFIQAESVQADVLQLRQDIAFEDAHFHRVFSADGTSPFA